MSTPQSTASRLGAMALSVALALPLASRAEVPVPQKAPPPAVSASKAATAASSNAAPAKDPSQKQSAPAGLPTVGSGKVPATGNSAADDARKAATVGAPGSSANTASGALAGAASSQLRQNAATIPGTISGVPAFNQGFQSNSAAVGQLQGAGGLGGNPASSLTGASSGGSAGGALTGIAAQGKGAISDGQGITSGTGTKFDDNGVSGGGDPKAAEEAARKLGLKVDGQKVLDNYSSVGSNTPAGQMLKQIEDEDKGVTPTKAAETAPPPAAKDEVTKNKDGSITHTYADGSVTNIVDNGDGTATITHYDAKGKKTEEKVPTNKEPTTKGSQCNSEDCNRGAAGRDKFLASNPAVAAQLSQAKAGGSGDVDPGRGDATAFVGGVGAVPSTTAVQQNLVGQPGQAGGLQEHGVVQTGFNFNNKNFGAVDPGPEGTVTAGNREDGRVADAIGGSPQRELPTQSCDADGRTADPADDCTKP